MPVLPTVFTLEPLESRDSQERQPFTEGWWPNSVAGGDPFQGSKVGSCLTLRKELSEETRADKARDFIGKGHPGGEQSGKGTQENLLCCVARSLGFYGDGISFRVVFDQSF